MRAVVSALMLATATGVVRWGCSDLRTDLEDEDDRDMLMRMNAEAMRAAGGAPRNDEHACQQKKLKRVRKRYAKARKPRSDRHFRLFATMIGNFGDYPSGLEVCGRSGVDARHSVELLVPDTSLYELHANALAPALGWLRRYHAYMFTLEKDGSQFGIAGKGHPHHRASGGYGAADLRGFVARDAYEVIDDRSVALGQVLRKGDELFYLYDLGDSWNYSVTVLDVVDAPLPGGVEVVDARCPRFDLSDLPMCVPTKLLSEGGKCPPPRGLYFACPPEDPIPDSPAERGFFTHDGVNDWISMVEDHYRAEREFRNFRLRMLALPYGESGYTSLEIEDWLTEDYADVIASIVNDDREAKWKDIAEYPMRVLHFLSLPFYPFRTVRDNTPYGEKLIADAQRRVDKAKTRPPDDRDDAHPGAHPHSATFRRINPGMAGHRAPGYAEL